MSVKSKAAAKLVGRAVPGVGEAIMVIEGTPAAAEGLTKLYAIQKDMGQKAKAKVKKRQFAGAAGEVASGMWQANVVATKGAAKVATAALIDQQAAEALFNPRRDETYAATWPLWGGYAYGNPAGLLTALQNVLAHLRALQWVYWTTHWTVGGDSFYGDHLLLERLYDNENIDKQIDGLGERMVALFGPEAVRPDVVGSLAQALVQPVAVASNKFQALAVLEASFQKAVKVAWTCNDTATNKSLGLDNFLMQIADERTVAQYLLSRRLGVVVAVSNPRRRARKKARRNISVAESALLGLVSGTAWGLLDHFNRPDRKARTNGETRKSLSPADLYKKWLAEADPDLQAVLRETRKLSRDEIKNKEKHETNQARKVYLRLVLFAREKKILVRETAKPNPRPGPFLKPPSGWPVGDKKHAKLALQYMAAGRGKPAEFPTLLRRLAQIWPDVPANRDIWSLFRKHRDHIAAHVAAARSPVRAAANPHRRGKPYVVVRGERSGCVVVSRHGSREAADKACPKPTRDTGCFVCAAETDRLGTSVELPIGSRVTVRNGTAYRQE